MINANQRKLLGDLVAEVNAEEQRQQQATGGFASAFYRTSSNTINNPQKKSEPASPAPSGNR